MDDTKRIRQTMNVIFMEEGTISSDKMPDTLEIDLPDRPDAAMLGAGFEASDLLARYSILTPAMLTYYKGVFGKVHAAAGGDLKNQEGSEVIMRGQRDGS